MFLHIQNGIEIQHSAQFVARLKTHLGPVFVFNQEIVIRNYNDFPLLLTNRHWEIKDLYLQSSELSGEGFTGQVPLILPNCSFSYSTLLHFRSFIGKIKGYYTLISSEDSRLFKIEFPEFQLIASHILN
ncbi:ApaG domain [Thermaurantimonas aggregans]|uniref:ApaG domain-containing protein n=1 Tax=Thermaurantimonas aggregans TaxID=2173829 RepID=UPI0013590C9C|nr:ApaG domain [Thermaurantimonas aggregans]MCX8148093.1 ApaG domain [Thermaurantimonas aggregans]